MGYKVDLGIRQVCLVAVAIGDRLIELGLIRSRVDHREHIAFLHLLTLAEADFDELAGDLAAYEHVVIRDHRADAAQVDRNIAAFDSGGNDAHGRRRRGRSFRRRRRKNRRACHHYATASGDDREHGDYRQRFGCEPCASNSCRA